MMEIRKLKSDDNFDELVLLSTEFFKEYESYHDYFFEIDELLKEHIIGYFTRWIDDDNGDTYIAIVNGEIVGYITIYVRKQADYMMVKKTGEISGLMIKKAHRHTGIAEKLFNASMEFFKKKEVKYFTLFTAIENQGALAFYKKQGMKPLDTTLIGEI